LSQLAKKPPWLIPVSRGEQSRTSFVFGKAGQLLQHGIDIAPLLLGTGTEPMGAGPDSGSDLFGVVGKVKILAGASPDCTRLSPWVAPMPVPVF